MRISLYQVPILFFAFSLTHVFSEAVIKCYQCNTYVNGSDCGSFHEKYKAPCPPKSTGCRKLEMEWVSKRADLPTGSADKDDLSRVIRQCSMKRGEPNTCTTHYGTRGKDIQTHYCECSGDFCNGAIPGAQQTSPYLLIISGAVVALVTFSQHSWVRV